MSRLPQPNTGAVRKTSSTRLLGTASQRASLVSAPGPRRPSTSSMAVGQRPPSQLQRQTFRSALQKSAADPHHPVRATGAQQTRMAQPVVQTKRGPEKVLQSIVSEKTVQRTPAAEYIAKTMTGLDVQPCTGRATQLELTSQKIDPTHATESAGVNQTISVTDSLTVTTGGKIQEKSIRKRTVKSSKLAKKANLNPNHIKRLVREESEDVTNTLRIAPPELVNATHAKAPLKRKLQNLRMNSEAMGQLRRKVTAATPTADEADTEAGPEVLATIIEAIEKGAKPKSDPNQVFNTLFPQVHDEKVDLSSVAPGPLEDIVIPTDSAKDEVNKSFTDEMRSAVVEVQTTQVPPRDDIATEQNIVAPKRTSTAANKLPRTITNEVPPWGREDVANLSILVGGPPIFNMEATDVTTLEDAPSFNAELSKGIDFFLDADTLPFENKVQMRGSKPPAWFPGYMSAFSHLPTIVQVNKTPSEVLLAAWKSVQPRMFPDEEIIII